jgi:hypothetical protein
MKSTVLFLALIACGHAAFSQAPAPSAPTAKRITITRTHADAEGKTVTETWIAEGESPETILRDMVAEAEGIRKVEIEQYNRWGEKEPIFYFRRAGEQPEVIAEGHPTNIQESDDAAIMAYLYAEEADKAHDRAQVVYVNRYTRTGNGNCAALGVRVVGHWGQDVGASITGLIEKGGAQAAGLQRGDIIRKVDEFEVVDYETLAFALGHYRPGDEVNVSFTRGDDYETRKVTLTGWGDLPGYSASPRPDCEPAQAIQEPAEASIPATATDTRKPVEALEPGDLRMFPNPTDGPVEISFTVDPGPLHVSVTDAGGRVVFQERSENGAGRYDGRIDLGRLAPGQYLLTVKQGDRVFTQQIVKQ